MELHGHSSDGFCSFAHRAEYYRRMQHVPEPAQRLAGFKPPIIGIGIEIGQPAHFRQNARDLRLPGAWYLSVLPKRGVRVRAAFRDIRPEAPPMASLRPVSTGAGAILTRIENWVIQHSGEPGWNVRPRLTPPRSKWSAPLMMRPFSQPVAAREHSATIKLGSDRFVINFPAATLEILPEFPALDLKPEQVVEPEYALPMSDPGSATKEITNWMRRSELALPSERSVRVHGLQTSEHLPLSPQLAGSKTDVAESGASTSATRFKMHAAGTLPALLNPGPPHPRSPVAPSMVGPRPQGSAESAASTGAISFKMHAAGTLPALLNPGPPHPCSPVTPSMVGPRPQSSDVNTPSLLDAPPHPHMFAPSPQFADAAIPEAQTDAALLGPRMWFAVRVPSPCVLETPTPVDMSKRLHYVHGARHICTTAIPAEVVWYPAGLRAGEIRILHATPDTLSDSVFGKLARSAVPESVPEISAALPPTASTIQRALPPIDQSPSIPDSFMPHNQPFSMGPAILWTGTRSEAALRERGPVTCEIRPIPDSPDLFPFEHRSQAEPAWVFQLASSIGASFAISVARTCEPEPGRVAIPDTTHRPWRKTAERASGSERIPQPVRLAPALAPFRRIANPESMQSSFATDLRDRIFNPILPAIPRTHLRPPSVEAIGSRLPESHVFAPVDFRWQRSRKVRDRGASWKAPAGISSLPGCEIPEWPGPLFSDGWPDTARWN